MIPFLDNVITPAEFAGALMAFLNRSTRLLAFRHPPSAIRNS